MRISFLSPEKAKLRRWNNDIKKPETTNNEQNEDLWTPRMQNGENCDTALSLYFPFLDMKKHSLLPFSKGRMEQTKARRVDRQGDEVDRPGKGSQWQEVER